MLVHSHDWNLRERERERETHTHTHTHTPFFVYITFQSFITPFDDSTDLGNHPFDFRGVTPPQTKKCGG